MVMISSRLRNRRGVAVRAYSEVALVKAGGWKSFVPCERASQTVVVAVREGDAG